MPPGRTREELDAREADRKELDLRPAMVPWPHPMCVAPASELSVRRAHLARVAAVVEARAATLRRIRARRKELKHKVQRRLRCRPHTCGTPPHGAPDTNTLLCHGVTTETVDRNAYQR